MLGYLFGPLTRLGLTAALIACAVDQAMKLWLLFSFDLANRGIVDNWKVALDAFDDQPLHGQGAGTYENWWNANRPARQATYNVTDAHSLYLEALGELGIVGFLLLAVLVASVLVALAPIRRGPNRPRRSRSKALGDTSATDSSPEITANTVERHRRHP